MTALPCLSIAGMRFHMSVLNSLIPPITGCCLSVKGAPLQAPLCVLSMLTQMC